MAIKYFPDLVQGTDDWLQARCGLLTASEMKKIITPATLKISANDEAKTHLYDLLAQRVTQYVEPQFEGYDMIRGKWEEVEAKTAYSKAYAPVNSMGFITNDKWGFTLGYSPDGLVGNDGQIEIKSKCQKLQFKTILGGEVPNEFMIQIQTGLLVSERVWCDFISYCGGVPMFTLRVIALPEMQDAILAAAKAFHEKLDDAQEKYNAMLALPAHRLIPTERKNYDDITIKAGE